MNMIEIIRASAVGVPEPIVPGESVVVEQGDRILCNVSLAELSSIVQSGNTLEIIVGGGSVTEFKLFFSFSYTSDPVIQFLDQELTATNLKKLLTVQLLYRDVDSYESQMSLLPGSIIYAHPGDIFSVDAQQFTIKDLRRDGNDLAVHTHDDSAVVVARIKDFFIATEEKIEAAQLRITDSSKSKTQDIIIHPTNPIFQWQGEPLPQAVVGSMYAYYFHLDAENSDQIVLVAKTIEGELPSWLTFTNLGGGRYLLSGLPTATAVGTHPISISAESLAQGISMHTEQAFNLLVHSTDDITTRTTADDVAAAEFRKGGQVIVADSYGGAIINIEQMPYMTMPEIATIMGLAALGPIAFKQPFSGEFTAQNIFAERMLESQAHLAPTKLIQTDLTKSAIGSESVFVEPPEVERILNPTAAGQESELFPTGGLSEVQSTNNFFAIPSSLTSEYVITGGQVQGGEVVPEMFMLPAGMTTTQSLLPYLSTPGVIPPPPPPPPPPLPTSLNIADLNGTNGFSLLSTTSADGFGYHSQIIPDVTGDGLADLLVVGPWNYEVTLLAGSTTPYPTSFDITAGGITGTVFTGTSPSAPADIFGIGDFNGDGMKDFMTTPFFDQYGYVVFGSASGFPANASFATLVGSGDAMQVTTGNFFIRATLLGDVNGDGLADIAFGNSGNARAYVLFGTSTPPSTIDVSTLNGINGFWITDPGSVPSNMGMSFADINGDGYNDIFLKTNDGVTEYVRVVFGGPGPFPAVVDAGALAMGDGFTIIDSSIAGNYRALGKFMANAGDINHDGFNDIMIVEQFTGKVFVIFGDPNFNSTTSFDVATLNGTNGFTISHTPYVYITNVSYLGDVNGDGIADISISEWSSYGYAGATHIIFGSDNPFPATMDLVQTDPTIGFTIIGEDVTHQLGTSGGGGDLNGDGLSDIVVNNYYGDSALAAHVIFGTNFSGYITVMGTSGDDVLTSTNPNDVIYGGAGNDTITALSGTNFINGGFGDDIINGGTGNDRIVYDPGDVTSVSGGTGTDTLWFKDDGAFADLRGSAVFSGIDVIDLHAMQPLTGNQVTLDAAEVTAMSDANTVTVNGGGHDSLQLAVADGWVISTPLLGYTTYTSLSGAVVNAQDTLHYVALV